MTKASQRILLEMPMSVMLKKVQDNQDEARSQSFEEFEVKYQTAETESEKFKITEPNSGERRQPKTNHFYFCCSRFK